MKKIIFILVSLFLLTNCKSGNIVKFVDINYQQTEIEKQIIKKIDSPLNIIFEDNFKNDRVKIYIDEELVFNQEISTGDIIGIASKYIVKNDYKKISIETDFTKISLNKKEIKIFKNIYIDKLPSNKLEILITNKLHFYK